MWPLLRYFNLLVPALLLSDFQFVILYDENLIFFLSRRPVIVNVLYIIFLQAEISLD